MLKISEQAGISTLLAFQWKMYATYSCYTANSTRGYWPDLWSNEKRLRAWILNQDEVDSELSQTLLHLVLIFGTVLLHAVSFEADVIWAERTVFIHRAYSQKVELTDLIW